MRHPRAAAFAMLWIICLLAGVTTRCSEPPALPIARPPPDQVVHDQAVYVIAGGWHTEIALPVSSIGGLLPALKLDATTARYLVFGWGARGYYMARHPGIEDLLQAVVPGPAVLLVIPLQTSPALFAGAANTLAVRVSRGGVRRLSQFLWQYLAKDAHGALRPLAAGPDPGSVFYASSRRFDLAHTCNTWTAEALRTAGVPVRSAGVIYAAQLLDQLPRPSAADMAEPDAPQ
jgi:uncharacterized protein (TIGR02117 family)